MAVSPFFDAFPKIKYDINQAQYPSFETVTNIFHRLGYVKEVLNTASAYYFYEIKSGDTPEILAEKVYGDPGANWMILYANNIMDPQWDWPIDDDVFNAYIIRKYGSIAAAQQSVHHYEKVVETTVNNSTHVERYVVDGFRLTQNALTDSPYAYYTAYKVPGSVTIDSLTPTVDSNLYSADNDTFASDTSLPHYDSYQAVDVNGSTVTVNIHGNYVSLYDYEMGLNESRRLIKIIKSDYYNQIRSEFNALTENMPAYVRRFK